MNRNRVDLRIPGSFLNMDLLIEKEVMKLSLGLDFGQLNIDDVTTAHIGNRLGGRGLSASRIAMKQESHGLRNALLLIPTPLVQEETDTLLDRVSLSEEHIIKTTRGMKLGLGIDQMIHGQWILGLIGLGTDHLVKLVQVTSEFIGNTTRLIHVAGINELLEVLDFVLVTEEAE